jgi:hypothetical protein
MRRAEPEALPPADEIAEKLKRHPQVEKIRAGGRDFDRWFSPPPEGDPWTAWGIKAEPDRVGMTYMAVDRAYPTEVPEVGIPRFIYSRYIKPDPAISPDMAERMAPKFGGPRELDRRYEVWVDDIGALAEEALDRQWHPTRDLRWEEMTPLAPEMERAFDQLLTYLIQCQYFCSDAFGPWLRLIHHAYFEVLSYGTYELFDYNLHAAVLRKRILANGGGMGVQVDGIDAGVLEVCNAASQEFTGEVERDFNAAVFAIDVFFNGLLLDILRLGEAGAQSRFDQDLLRQMIQDEARHVAWGCKRLRYYLAHVPDRAAAEARLHGIAARTEAAQTEHHLLNPKVLEPLAVLLGGGPSGAAAGFETLRRFWPQFAAHYLARLDWIGLPRRGRSLLPAESPF